MRKKPLRDDYWAIVYNTGGYGNNYRTLKEAQTYADAANRFSEQNQNERVVRSLIHVVNGEVVKTVPA